MSCSVPQPRYAGGAVGIVMTGIGDDGTKGMLEMRNAGAYTVAQDEQSCGVFGVPKEAVKIDAVGKILFLREIAQHIVRVG